MGLLNWLFGSSAPATAPVGTIEGPGSFAFEIVGESNYQGTLTKICGGKTEEGHNRRTLAALVCEDSNPYDNMAVRVDIEDMTVGYLSRTNARQYRAELKRQNLEGATLKCGAIINGGWDRDSGDNGYFGVQLDLPIEKGTAAEKPKRVHKPAPRDIEAAKVGHFTDATDTVKQLKREGRLEEAESLLLWCVGETEKESRYGVAPWYYEQLAIIYRKQGRTEDEVAILERYASQKHAPGATPAKLADRLEKLRAKLAE